MLLGETTTKKSDCSPRRLNVHSEGGEHKEDANKPKRRRQGNRWLTQPHQNGLLLPGSSCLHLSAFSQHADSRQPHSPCCYPYKRLWQLMGFKRSILGARVHLPRMCVSLVHIVAHACLLLLSLFSGDNSHSSTRRKLGTLTISRVLQMFSRQETEIVP